MTSSAPAALFTFCNGVRHTKETESANELVRGADQEVEEETAKETGQGQRESVVGNQDIQAEKDCTANTAVALAATTSRLR
jgi:hypothetical protein